MEISLYTLVATYFFTRLAILAGVGYLIYMAVRPKASRPNIATSRVQNTPALAVGAH